MFFIVGVYRNQLSRGNNNYKYLGRYSALDFLFFTKFKTRKNTKAMESVLEDVGFIRSYKPIIGFVTPSKSVFFSLRTALHRLMSVTLIRAFRSAH